MKKHGFLLLVLVVLVLSACNISGPSEPAKRFDFKLQGTWISNDPSDYDGVLVIDYSSIKISGYKSNPFYESFLEKGIDDRPFKDYLKDVSITGYSEWLEGSNKTKGEIYIEDFGEIKEGIPFEYWETYDKQTFKNQYFLRFKFGTRNEVLKQVPNNYFDKDDEDE